MNTFFVSNLLESDYEKAKRWTRKANIFSFDKILIPVDVNQPHWCIAIIHLKEKRIQYCDSIVVCQVNF